MTSIDFLCTIQHNDQQYTYQHSLASDPDYTPLSTPISSLTDVQLATKDYTHRPIASDPNANVRPCRIVTLPDMPHLHADQFIQSFNDSSIWQYDRALSRATINPLIKVLYHYDVFHYGSRYFILCDQGIIRWTKDATDLTPERMRILAFQYGDVPYLPDGRDTYPESISLDSGGWRESATDIFKAETDFEPTIESELYSRWLNRNFLYPTEPKNTDSKIRPMLYKQFSPYSIVSESHIQLLCVREDNKTIDMVTLEYISFNDTWHIPDLPVTLANLKYPIVRI